MSRYEAVQRWELRRHKGERKGTRALLDVLLVLFHAHGARSGGIYNRRLVRGGSSWSLHSVGRACDVMVQRQDIGDLIAGVVVARAEGLGVCEVIWNRRRWTPERGWVGYAGTNPHTDHVHIGQTISVADSPASLEQLHAWFAAVLR